MDTIKALRLIQNDERVDLHARTYAEAAADELTLLRERLEAAERTVRQWHRVALKMRDTAITLGPEKIEDIYFDAAMSIPFYGADPEPLPCQVEAARNQPNS